MSVALPTWTYWLMLTVSVFAAVGFVVCLEWAIDRVLHLAGVGAGASGGAATPSENAGQVGLAVFQAGVVAPPEGSTGGTPGVSD